MLILAVAMNEAVVPSGQLDPAEDFSEAFAQTPQYLGCSHTNAAIPLIWFCTSVSLSVDGGTSAAIDKRVPT